ncbi:hypothetical protein O181_004318 [Austropuccinia psidii MF-1]|uniref:Checkpoint protein n=1 Tax=Austropuccinia psidii MF-1 TaxID=1389203 RepID=A0A9Q3GEF2_9BASI|nr:hypothetical protein [Austropuccinia psidii MF-1]
MRFRAQLINSSAFTKLVDSITKLTKRAVFKFNREELRIVSTGDLEDGVRFYAGVQIVELFGFHYHIESNFENSISLELSTYALASAIRQSSGVPTEILIRLGKIAKTPFLSFTSKTVGRSGVEYEVEQRVAVRVLRPAEAQALPDPTCPIPDVHLNLPKLADVCKVAERLKTLSDSIQVSASRLGGFRLGICTEHAKVETEWRGLTVFRSSSSQEGEEASMPIRTPRPTASFFQVTVKSRGLLRFLHAHAVGQVSLASVCEGHSLILFIYMGDPEKSNSAENNESMPGSLIAFLPAVDEDGDL